MWRPHPRRRRSRSPDLALGERLAFIEADSEPTFVTSEDEWAASPTCSPDGSFIAAAHSDDLNGEASRSISVFDEDGGSIDTFTPSEGSDYASPLWSEEGLLFLRVPPDGAGPEVWLTPSGGEPQETGIVIGDVPGNPEERRDGWGRFIDWGADAPTGLSVTTEPGG